MTGPAGEGPSATHHLLERDREIAEIDAAVDGAARGDGGVVLIEGPAGIGKTRLIQEARRRATGRGMRVLTARGAVDRSVDLRDLAVALEEVVGGGGSLPGGSGHARA